MPFHDERLRDLMTSRPMIVDLPIGAERRIKAYLHRINAELASSDYDGDLCQIGDDDFDLACAPWSRCRRAGA